LEEPRAVGQPNILLAIPAWTPGEALGVKLVTSFPGNLDRFGIPTVNALYVLFDAESGVPKAVIDGEALIFRKTAADSALGASFLAREDAETLLMVGAGALAPYLISAHLSVRPSIRKVIIWNRTASKAEALADRVMADESVEVTATRDLEWAVSRADIISSATMAEQPLIHGVSVRPGTHVDVVGSFTPSMREADDELLQRSRIFVDSYGCLERSGELLDPLKRGVITREDILADLVSLCGNHNSGRGTPDDITLYKNGGAGHLDLFVAQHLMERLEKAAAREAAPAL